MKIVGLITEYNPFHNGHKYHIEKAKELTGADAAIVVMSGNYVQRGAPAIMPKQLRAEAALKSGVSVVMELPVCYAVGSAEYFARGAISLFESLGCIDAVCFGSECGDYDILERIAHVAADEPDEYKDALQEFLKAGNTFPLARQKAIKAYLKDDALDVILEQPNNILGIEYIKALYLSKSPIKALTIKRKVSNYHDIELPDAYGSASAIRKLLAYSGNAIHLDSDSLYDEPVLSDVLTRLEDHVPHDCIRMFEETHRIRYPIYANDFSLMLKYQLLRETKESLTEYVDVSVDLANRIVNELNNYISFDQFCDLLKTREITYSRISRVLFHILLNIKKAPLLQYGENDFALYARILGFRKADSNVLRKLKEHSSIPLITRPAIDNGLTELGRQMLEHDILAGNIYESVITDKFKLPFINEYSHPLLTI